MGRENALQYELNALLDEVRISNIARSSFWIKTEYNNQSNPKAFASVSAQQARVKTVPGVLFR